jgi:hypothetical protein
MTEHYIRSSKKSTNLQKAQISSDSTYSSPRTDMDSFTNYTRDLLKTNKSVDIQLVPKQRLQTTIPTLPALVISRRCISRSQIAKKFLPETKLVGMIHAIFCSSAATNGEHYCQPKPSWRASSNQLFHGIQKLPDSLFLFFDILEQNMNISKNVDSINSLK